MTWLSRLFSGGEKQRKKKQRSKNQRSKKTKAPTRVRRFQGVSIHGTNAHCDAAERIKHQRFLASYAPQLPLGGCDNPQTCSCKYRYFSDRRVGPRRDSDIGLPNSTSQRSDRRYRRERRRAS
ncbi:MAG: hypothetical protein ACI9UU_002220 [Candidatus Azotimanducaceae bacterium]|jgi:hypothetical protein